ncbi:hypothetical protein ACLBYG_31245 [Methylobacterium sp. D53M]
MAILFFPLQDWQIQFIANAAVIKFKSSQAATAQPNDYLYLMCRRQPDQRDLSPSEWQLEVDNTHHCRYVVEAFEVDCLNSGFSGLRQRASREQARPGP